MKIIVLFGDVETAKAAYTFVDMALRARDERGVALVLTDWAIDRPTAAFLRQEGIELWYCAARLTPPADGTAAEADRFVLSDRPAGIEHKALAALSAFLDQTRPAP